jgi:sulfur carrier protein ThiS
MPPLQRVSLGEDIITVRLKIHPLLIENGLEPVVINVNGGTVGECLEDASRKIDGLRKDHIYDGDKLMGDVLVYVNGEDIFPDELDAVVRDGDNLELITIIGGG